MLSRWLEGDPESSHHLNFNGAKQKRTKDGLTITIPGMRCGSEGRCNFEEIGETDKIILDCRPKRPLHSGPFLTVQRRRRRRRYVRTYGLQDPSLTDDLSPYQTVFLLTRIHHWNFNAFTLDNVTGGRPLPNLCVHLFKTYGLYNAFNLDPVIIWKLFSIIEDGYHWRNPYHNAIHAADVTQAMHCFLQESFILQKLEPIEIFSAILAAVTHDLDHPGVNQPFLVATSNHLVALYKNSSVLENHHWRSAMGCLSESGVSAVLGKENVEKIEKQIKSLVLATDITRQQEFLTRLKEYMETDTLDMNCSEVRHFVLQIALKCADICNPCRSWDISKKWSLKVCEEFFRQGDYERQLNLPLTPICDRNSTSVPKIQTGFLTHVVRPLFEEWDKMMRTPLSNLMMRNLDSNDEKWKKLLENSQLGLPLDYGNDNEFGLSIPRSRGESESSSIVLSSRLRLVAASESESDGEEGRRSEEEKDSFPKERRRSEFLSIPRPDGRRHSIATGLMGDSMQIPADLLTSSLISGEDRSRVIGRTTIRRESLPGTKLFRDRTTLLHLQRISRGGGGGGGGEEDLSEEGTRSKSSCSSDEIYDVLIPSPSPSTSPHRRSHESEVDELCPGTSILSMSNRVAHITITHGSDYEEQRRVLIRQQTCPVVSSDTFNRPRFLSAAAAISPTSVASIISKQQEKNSPIREEDPSSPPTREQLTFQQPIRSDFSTSSPIRSDIATQQPIRSDIATSSTMRGDIATSSPIRGDIANRGDYSSHQPIRGDFVSHQSFRSDIASSSPIKGDIATPQPIRGDFSSSSLIRTDIASQQPIRSDIASQQPMRGDIANQQPMREGGVEKFGPIRERSENSSSNEDSPLEIFVSQFPANDENNEGNFSDGIFYEAEAEFEEDEKEECSWLRNDNFSASRLATILMWRNQRLWKSLTEEGEEKGDDWEKFTLHNTASNRRGSAPNAPPALGLRGGVDRRSDPTQYHSTPPSLYKNSIISDYTKISTRRGSVPIELLRNTSVRNSLNKKNWSCGGRMGRRGSLPIEMYTRAYGSCSSESESSSGGDGSDM